jgi:gamma-glutamyltranspeptidase / glutathione hydrolase / leukotriene-C4 hydrolase
VLFNSNSSVGGEGSSAGTYNVIDFRETAPAGAHKDMFVNDPSLAQLGGKAVGVPGELRGLWEAHQLNGRLPWKSLIMPSVILSERGWRVDTILAKRILSSAKYILNDTAALGRVFAPNGKLLVEGDWIRRPVYAKTLASIANNGVDEFYNGSIANALISTIKGRGGIMTHEDLAGYKVEHRKIVTSKYRGRQIVTTPPPSSGAVLLSVLGIIDHYNEFADTPLNSHRLVETFKHGYAQRSYYGDPIDPVYTNITGIMQHFLREKQYKEIFSMINDVLYSNHADSHFRC